ncbi:DUF2140 family protein [Alicyclobacillus sp. SO9]|uniref:DUF2140 family protein n=1 Tax=Alicyclobacillus sp. SO9 TaxID=2665646 RepID=UPI0018E6F91F|nr:DUF2140 family protein [Alicyclobacillus sp. SO9]QQE79498.1 DUF2140 family protein [Alicyclobacillus sp. SO9]
MWKKAFILLLAINLLIVVGITSWWATLPSPQSKKGQTPPTPVTKTANVQISVGQDAINSYLEYALSNQKDVKNVLAYARVNFNQNWDVQLGAKLANKVIPLNVVFIPTVLNGNLQLHMKSADLGQVPVPTAYLFLVLRHLPWPNWITVDALHSTLNLNFTKRPQKPYGVRILKYDQKTKMLTLQVSIVPKSLLSKNFGTSGGSSSGSAAKGPSKSAGSSANSAGAPGSSGSSNSTPASSSAANSIGSQGNSTPANSPFTNSLLG